MFAFQNGNLFYFPPGQWSVLSNVLHLQQEFKLCVIAFEQFVISGAYGLNTLRHFYHQSFLCVWQLCLLNFIRVLKENKASLVETATSGEHEVLLSTRLYSM